MMTDLNNTIVTFLTAEQGLDADSFDADTALFSTGLLDSFILVEIIDLVEKTQGIKVRAADVQLDNFDTIAKIMAYVEGRT